MRVKRIAIIPAYEPPSSFIEYAKKLSQVVDHLVIVNDGSDRRFSFVFQAIGSLNNAAIISYEKNCGKGYALKQAFRYCGDHFSGEDIVVTADCDGQHTISDVTAVCNAAAQHADACVLGVRDFSQPNVPPRSKAGNTQTLKLLRWLYSIQLTDSQTGLRAFSVKTAQEFLKVGGNRFEYETGTLIFAKRNQIPFRQIPIQTVYPQRKEDHVSHFKTFRDSWRVIGIMLRYLPGKQKKTGFYGKYARFVRWLFRAFSPRYQARITQQEGPVVYVCRHLNMHGPMTTLKWLPFQLHPMIIHMFFTRKKTVEHMTKYTFSARYGRKPPRFSLPAHVMSWITPPMMHSLQAVPVYRDGIQSLSTLKQGLKYLLKGENLIVYPDIDYTGNYEKPSQIYDGFLLLGELYYKKTGQPLAFIPLVVDDKNRQITEGAAIYVRDFRKESADAAGYLRKMINKTPCHLETLL